MSCACTIDYAYDEGEGVTFENTDRKARKEHKCDECGRTIKKGETYHYDKGMWEGDFYTHKTCADCYSLRKQYCCAFVYGSLLNDLENKVFDVGCGEAFLDSRVKELTPAAKEKLFEMIEECWGEDDVL